MTEHLSSVEGTQSRDWSIYLKASTYISAVSDQGIAEAQSHRQCCELQLERKKGKCHKKPMPTANYILHRGEFPPPVPSHTPDNPLPIPPHVSEAWSTIRLTRVKIKEIFSCQSVPKGTRALTGAGVQAWLLTTTNQDYIPLLRLIHGSESCAK